MTPANDEGRPGEGNGLDVDTTVNNDIIAQQLRRRRDAKQRCEPSLSDNRRDVLDAPAVRKKAAPRNVVGITMRGTLALVRGWPAVELLEAAAAPRQWSRAGKGYVVQARYVADLLAVAETRHIFVSLVEERGGVSDDFDPWADQWTPDSTTSRSRHEDDVLLDVERFLARFVAYPSEHARVAHVLWVAHAHLMDQWESTPRIAFLSPEPGSGKSRALEVTELLVPRPEHAVNASPAALFRAVSAPEGPPTILFDEIDTVFGPKAKDNEDIRGMLNAGHRRGATALRCVMRGQTAELERFPAYCAVALAGLGDLPDTVLSRSVVIKMRRRAPNERVEPFRSRLHREGGHDIRDRLMVWAEKVQPSIEWPDMPDGVEDRAADVWEALLACANVAGGDWPHRATVAAVSLVTQASEGVQTFGVQLLKDINTIFISEKFSTLNHITTSVLVDALCEQEESPWGDMRGKPLDPRGLARRLKPYGITPKVIRVGDTTLRGYDRADFHDAWARYLPGTPSQDPVTSETPQHREASVCATCQEPMILVEVDQLTHPHCEAAA